MPNLRALSLVCFVVISGFLFAWTRDPAPLELGDSGSSTCIPEIQYWLILDASEEPEIFAQNRRSDDGEAIIDTQAAASQRAISVTRADFDAFIGAKKRANGLSSKYDGDWVGTTNQDRPIEFTVANGLVALSIEVRVQGTCTVEAAVVTSTQLDKWIFSINTTMGPQRLTINGSFSSPTACSGSWSFSDSTCSASDSGNWNADRDSSNRVPNIWITPTSFSLAELDVVGSFASPGPEPQGTAFDGTHLRHADSDADEIFKIDRNGTVVDSIDTPGPNPRGLAFDGQYLWCLDYANKNLYKLNDYGDILATHNTGFPSPAGLTFDGSRLWASCWVNDRIYQMDLSGGVITSVSAPCGGGMDGPAGLAFDGTHVWCLCPRQMKLHQLDAAGHAVSSVDLPNSIDWGKDPAFDGQAFWIGDYHNHTVVKAIIPSVTVGQPMRKAYTVTNYGLANLSIGALSLSGPNASECVIEDDQCSNRVLASQQSGTFDIVCTPQSIGTKTATLTIPSNDPDTPNLQVSIDVPVSAERPSGFRCMPHVSRASGGFEPGVIISNLAETSRSYVLTPYQQDGTPLGDVAGDLPGQATQYRSLMDVFGTDSVSHFTVWGDDEVRVTVTYTSTSGHGTPVHIHATSDLAKAWRLFPGNWDVVWDGVAIVNMGMNPADVTVSQVDGDGRVTESHKVFQLDPNEKGLYVFGSDFAFLPEHHFTISSTENLAITAIRGSTDNVYLWANLPIIEASNSGD